MGNTLQTLPQEDKKGDVEMQPPPNPEEEEEEVAVFTCEICIEPTSFPLKKTQISGDKCSHPFCADCMIKYIVAKLEYGAAGARIRCPALTCDRTLDPRAWEPLVGPSVYGRWCDALCEAAIGDLSRCHCPHADCNALIVSECGGAAAGKSKCPGCGRWFCFECGRAWHAGFGCDETRDRNDVAFGRLAEERKWRRCPRCRHFVELVDGCRNVKCRCGMWFCHGCGERHGSCHCYRFTNDVICDRYMGCWCFVSFVIYVFLIVCLLISRKQAGSEH